jgi:hypothetical protein
MKISSVFARRLGALTQQRYEGTKRTPRLRTPTGNPRASLLPMDNPLLPIETPDWVKTAMVASSQSTTTLNSITSNDDAARVVYSSILSFCQSGCHALALSLYRTAPRSILSQSMTLTLSERKTLYVSLLTSAGSLLDPKCFEEILQSAYQDTSCGEIFSENMKGLFADLLSILYIQCGKDEQSVHQYLININLARNNSPNESRNSSLSLAMQIKSVALALANRDPDQGTRSLLHLSHLLRLRAQEHDEAKQVIADEMTEENMQIINSILRSFPRSGLKSPLDSENDLINESEDLAKKVFFLCISQGHGGAATAAYYAHRSIIRNSSINVGGGVGDTRRRRRSDGGEVDLLDSTVCLQGAVSAASPSLAEAVIFDLYMRRDDLVDFDARLVEALNFLARAYAAAGDATGSIRTLCLIPHVMGASPDAASSKAAAHCLQKLALQMFYWERTFRKQQEAEGEGDDFSSASVPQKGSSSKTNDSNLSANNDVDDGGGNVKVDLDSIPPLAASPSSGATSSSSLAGGDVEFSIRPNRPEALQALATGYSVGSFLVRVACLASAEAHLLGNSSSLRQKNHQSIDNISEDSEDLKQTDGWLNLLESAVSNADQLLLNNNVDLPLISTSFSVSTLLNNQHGGAAQSLPAGNWRMFDTAKQTLGLPLQGRLSDVSDAAVLFPPALSALLWGMALSRARGNGPIFADYAMRSLGCEPTSEVFAALIAGHARDHREMNASSYASATDTLWRMAEAKVEYTSSIYSELILLWLRAKLIDRAFYTLKLALDNGLTVQSRLFRACIRACSSPQSPFAGDAETAAAFAEFNEAADVIVGRVSGKKVGVEDIKQLQILFKIQD